MATVVQVYPLHPDFTLEDLQAIADSFDAHAGMPASRVTFGWHAGRRRYISLCQDQRDGLNSAAFDTHVQLIRAAATHALPRVVETFKEWLRAHHHPVVVKDEIPVDVNTHVGGGFVQFTAQVPDDVPEERRRV